MNFAAALEIIDEAIAAIDEFDILYRRACDAHDGAFRILWDRALMIEHETVLPRLELVRQIAAHVNADDLSVSAPPDKSMYVSHPFETNRAAMVILRTRIKETERMDEVLGTSGARLATSTFHPAIWGGAPSRLFDGDHYRQAVQMAAQALEAHLQAIAGPSLSGQDLAKLFGNGGDGVRLHFAQLDASGKTYTSAREGAAGLIRGAMMAVRNLVSHPEWPDPTKDESLEMLAVLSFVAHLVDQAEQIP